MLTAADVPYNAFGLIDADQPVLCGERGPLRRRQGRAGRRRDDGSRRRRRARWCASTTRICRRSPTRARRWRRDAPLVHAARAPTSCCTCPIRKGDVAAAFADADVVLEGEFATAWQEHAFLQPEAGIAYVDDAGPARRSRRPASGCTRTAGRSRQMLRLPGGAGRRPLRGDRRRVRRARGSLDPAPAGAGGLEAAPAGRDRLEPRGVDRRPPQAPPDDDPLPLGRDARRQDHRRRSRGPRRRRRLRLDQRRGDRRSPRSSPAAATRCPNIAVDGYAVYTNNVPSGAFRGFGAPQAQFAAEIMVTRLAHALGIDPVELRRRNLYREGSIEPTQQPLPPGVSAPGAGALRRGGAARGCCNGPADQQPANQEPRTEARTGNQAERRTENQTAAETRLELETRNLIPALNPNSELDLTAVSAEGSASPAASRTSATRSAFPSRRRRRSSCSGGATIEHGHVRVGAADVGQGAHLALRQIAAESARRAVRQDRDDHRRQQRGAERRQRLGLAPDPDGRPRGARRRRPRRSQTWQDEERPARRRSSTGRRRRRRSIR